MARVAVRILYLADIRFPLERANGIQSMETCHALARRGHDVTLIVRPDTHVPARDPFAFYGLPRIAQLTVEVAPVSGPPIARRTGYLTFALGRALGRARQDLIFTRDLALASLLLHLPAAARAPVIYESHGLAAEVAAERPALLAGGDAPSASKLRRLTARDLRVWQRADGYVTITRALKEELERRYGGRRRVAVVADGTRAVNSQDPTPNSQAPHTFTIGYAGHLYPWKGVDLVVEAVAAITDSRGLIVGGHAQETDLGRMQKLAEDRYCSERITFTGLLPPPQVAARLREADVLVLPNPATTISRGYTSPLKLFEYMASRRPIVASDLPSIREVLTHERNALLVEAGNAHALTEGIRRIKEDRELGARLAAQALDDVRDYSWERRAERLETLLTEVLEMRAVRGVQ